MNKETILMTDWSIECSGFVLKQKNCKSKIVEERLNPDCCETGWDLIWAGSKASTKLERNYVVIEGECLAIAIALEKCRYYIQGRRITVITDHKPLIGIWNRVTVTEDEKRLTRLRQRWDNFNVKLQYISDKND